MSERARPARPPASAWLLDVDDTLLDTAGAMRAAAPMAIASLVPGLSSHEAQALGEAYYLDAGGAFERYTRGEIGLHRSRGERLLAAFRDRGFTPPEEHHDLEEWGGQFEMMFAPRFLARQQLFRDVEPALARALRSGIRVGLLTNAAEGLTRAKLRATPLATFPFVCVVTRDTLGFGKPDVRVFHQAAQLLAPDLPRDEVLYVGDSLTIDVRPADRAGLHGVWLDRGHAGSRVLGDSARPNDACDVTRVQALSDLFAFSQGADAVDLC